ncbi:hypothetical protein HCZ23_13150 [Celeribacter sp. HF31]|uniref:hypothetical protein n=1 Tax=Celeribacter sp. HF31 TaxID=2721558 RepID=UPI00142FFD50|nr:hypothetical protein [Celeribacter sp. HF31]NIY80407.1 hypothetical protein [Celeribacter sp. HF31]
MYIDDHLPRHILAGVLFLKSDLVAEAFLLKPEARFEQKRCATLKCSARFDFL